MSLANEHGLYTRGPEAEELELQEDEEYDEPEREWVMPMPAPYEFPRKWPRALTSRGVETEPCPAYMLREGDMLVHQDFHGNIGMIVRIDSSVLDKRGDFTCLDVSALTGGVIKTVRFGMAQEVEIFGDGKERTCD